MSAFDDGPIAPGRVDTLARQLMEFAEFERARALADIMIDWWQRHPGASERIENGWFWLGILSAAGAAAYGAQHRRATEDARRRASSPRGRVVGG